MKVLSAADAITPAWNHTRALMLKPFRWLRFLKLSFAALLAQFGLLGLMMPVYSIFFFIDWKHPNSGFALTPLHLALASAGTVMMIVLGFVVFYLGSRLQLVIFEIVATRQTAIGPIWRKYAAQTWRWMGLRFLVGCCCILLLGIFGGLYCLLFWTKLSHLPNAGQTGVTGSNDLASVLLPMIGLYAAMIVFEIAIGIVISLMNDFTLPYLALEDLSMGNSVRRSCAFVKEWLGGTALYLLLKFCLYMAMAIIAEIVLFIAMLVPVALFALMAGLLHLLLHNLGGVGTVLQVSAVVLGALLSFVWMVVIYFGILGYIMVWLQAYAIYFMGGRYPLLAALLEPPVVPPSEPVAAIG